MKLNDCHFCERATVQSHRRKRRKDSIEKRRETDPFIPLSAKIYIKIYDIGLFLKVISRRFLEPRTPIIHSLLFKKEKKKKSFN